MAGVGAAFAACNPARQRVAPVVESEFPHSDATEFFIIDDVKVKLRIRYSSTWDRKVGMSNASKSASGRQA